MEAGRPQRPGRRPGGKFDSDRRLHEKARVIGLGISVSPPRITAAPVLPVPKGVLIPRRHCLHQSVDHRPRSSLNRPAYRCKVMTPVRSGQARCSDSALVNIAR